MEMSLLIETGLALIGPCSLSEFRLDTLYVYGALFSYGYEGKLAAFGHMLHEMERSIVGNLLQVMSC